MAALHTLHPDPKAVDWSRVTSAVYRVRHHYRYTYSGPVHDLRQRLMMVPARRHGDQRLLSDNLEVRGTTGRLEVAWEEDTFGNRVCLVQAERVERAIDFEATYSVRRGDAPGAALARRRDRGSATCDVSLKLTREQLAGYLAFTSLTAPDERLRSAAEAIRARASTPLEQAELAHDWAASAINYKIGVTGVQTPAAMALYLGAGVCQDYAHIQLAIMRSLGIPCRYVSGHLLGEGAPHAWVEALVPDSQAPEGISVAAYDPTHHRRAGRGYINVAIGRDFADVTMTSGSFSGAASGKLSYTKKAEIMEITEREDGRAGEEAAA